MNKQSAIIISIVAVILLLLGNSLVMRNDSLIEKDRVFRELVAENQALQAKASEFKMKLGRIRAEESSTFAEYYQQCLKLESLLNEYDPIHERYRGYLARIADRFEGDAQGKQRYEIITKIEEKDSQILEKFRQEISRGKALISLPKDRQRGWYESNIVPLRNEIVRLQKEEMELITGFKSGSPSLSNDPSKQQEK